MIATAAATIKKSKLFLHLSTILLIHSWSYGLQVHYLNLFAINIHENRTIKTDELITSWAIRIRTHKSM